MTGAFDLAFLAFFFFDNAGLKNAIRKRTSFVSLDCFCGNDIMNVRELGSSH